MSSSPPQVAQGTCESRPVTGLDREGLAEGAPALRGVVEETVEYCLDDFPYRLLGLY